VRNFVLAFVIGTCAMSASASAQAATVSVRVEGVGGQLVPLTNVTLPTTPVAPLGAPDGQTCPGNSVVGAVSAATGNDWSGTWSDTTGFSIDRIKTLDNTGSLARNWAVFWNQTFLNDSPCQKLLSDRDSLIIYPRCIGQSTAQCFPGFPLVLFTTEIVGPGSPFGVTVRELTTTFDNGLGTTQAAPAVNTTVSGPEGSATTDPYFGRASLQIFAKGPAVISAAKFGAVPDRANVCVTDGADGYCGTQVPPQTPFDPYQFCKTTGNDGYCNSPDQVAPVGHVTSPTQGRAFAKSERPRVLSGTVDFDPSQIDQVNIRLLRQTTVTASRFTKKRVTVKRRLHGKLVRKKVTKRVRVRYKKKACLYWSVSTSTWKTLKKCDITTAPLFKADGDEAWSFEFLQGMPAGSYTLDALARDGAGNVDAVPEAGRNRVTFSVK
jgi:hypothetical protein